MKRIAIIGAGISGMTVAQLLKERQHEELTVVVYEKERTPGGLIRCEQVDGSLFHTCGGHIFNSHDEKVLAWFWQHFDREKEFVKADRNSVIFLPDGNHIPYPIENYAYMLDEPLQRAFISDLLRQTDSSRTSQSGSFENFLLHRFGETLYNLYFGPYNRKVWQCSLKDVPLDWLEGKLPMPTREDIIYNNFNRVAEKQFVHATFYYERQGGSQLIADRLAEGLDIRYGEDVKQLRSAGPQQWLLNGETFDAVIFCSNIKDLPAMLENIDLRGYTEAIDSLAYHGTTTVFCEIDANPYSWIYLPDERYRPHRVICTGNFSPTNNGKGITARNGRRTTASIEFTGYVDENEMMDNLRQIPLHPTYITHRYNEYTYPLQNRETRTMIASLKKILAGEGLYLTGRFADWEYYNMDAAMAAAMKTVDMI